MFKLDQNTTTQLKRFMIQISNGTTLFKQNDKGNTLYVIVEGSIRLLHKDPQGERVISLIGPGEIVGEKALYTEGPYRRAFTAVAQGDCVALEFDSQSLKAIASKTPEFSIKLLTMVVERLDRANSLVSVLQTIDPIERVIRYLRHLCEHHSKRLSTGVEIEVEPEATRLVLGISAEVIQDCLEELKAEKILIARGTTYQVADENALTQYLPSLQDRLAA